MDLLNRLFSERDLRRQIAKARLEIKTFPHCFGEIYYLCFLKLEMSKFGREKTTDFGFPEFNNGGI